MRSIFFCLLSTSSLITLCATAADGTNGPSNQVKIDYQNIVGERYLALTIIRNGKPVRTIKGDIDNVGTFERESPANLSKNGEFVIINQIQSNHVLKPNGAPIYHEIAYCNLINTYNGCIIARETGEFCGGTFSETNKWDNPVYSDFDLHFETPKAQDYAQGRRKLSELPDSSFANLLACDPPNKENADAYRAINDSRLIIP